VAVAVLSCPIYGAAQRPQAINLGFVGAGSSAAFNAFAFAAIGLGGSTTPACEATGSGGINIWTKKKGTLQGVDSRTSNGVTPSAVNGSAWVTWDGAADGSTAQTICEYLNIDSVVGNRLFFAQPQATVNFSGGCASSIAADTGVVPLVSPVALPANICSALQGASINAAISDIRAEDSKYATERAFETFGTTIMGYKGLGYCNPCVDTPNRNIGQNILEAYGSSPASAQPVEYNITGTDPITGTTVPAFTTFDVGGQVALVLYNDTDTATGGLGTGLFTDVGEFVLGRMFAGVLSRTSDLNTGGGTGLPMSVLMREPLSGTMNTIEYQITNNAEVKLSQETNDPTVPPTGGTSNPLDVPATCTKAKCTPSGSYRLRVIGTGDMIKHLGLAGTESDNLGKTTFPDALGYAFFSFGNVAPVAAGGSSCPSGAPPTGCVKYVQVNGTDPLFSSYSANPVAPGVLPTCAPPCPGAVSFTHVIDGTYPVWNVLRVITQTSHPAPLASALVAGAQVEVSNVPDFVPLASLLAFRSHYNQCSNVGCTTTITGKDGNNAGIVESGGDVAGAVFQIKNDKNYDTDTGKELTGFKQ